jgi:hypothetical protein
MFKLLGGQRINIKRFSGPALWGEVPQDLQPPDIGAVSFHTNATLFIVQRTGG